MSAQIISNLFHLTIALHLQLRKDNVLHKYSQSYSLTIHSIFWYYTQRKALTTCWYVLRPQRGQYRQYPKYSYAFAQTLLNTYQSYPSTLLSIILSHRLEGNSSTFICFWCRIACKLKLRLWRRHQRGTRFNFTKLRPIFEPLWIVEIPMDLRSLEAQVFLLPFRGRTRNKDVQGHWNQWGDS